MANKHVKYSFSGANQDISKSKHPKEHYFEANHIRLLATNSQSTAAISNEKGNKVVAVIPNFLIQPLYNNIKYGNKTITLRHDNELFDQLFPNGATRENVESGCNTIIGSVNTRDGIILFTTNDKGLDAIWYIKDIITSEYNIELLYVRKLGFSVNNPIQAIFNYENENIQKVYWVDGLNQIRFININHHTIPGNSPLMDIPYTNINFVGQIEYSQPMITGMGSGGDHTAGMIQYAYNLFRLNGSQTKISPLSELVPLAKEEGAGGGGLNENVGASPIIKIEDLDMRYTHIRVYAIKYTSYNEIPSINLIDEREFINNSITLLDDGSTIEELSLAQFLFLGSDPSIPKHIETKDNRLFPSNITTKAFMLPDTFDFRAYSFPRNEATTYVSDAVTGWENNTAVTQGKIPVTNSYNVPLKHSAINTNFDYFRYQESSTKIGGSGKLLSYELTSKDILEITQARLNKLKFFKDEEVYRIGIHLYNELGQTSEPQWIADFKSNEGNLQGSYNTLKVTLNQNFLDLVETYNNENAGAKIIGYKVLRAKRTINDYTIIDQGVLSNMIFQIKDHSAIATGGVPSSDGYSNTELKVPTFAIRHVEHYPQVVGGSGWNAGDGVLVRNLHRSTLSNEFFVGKTGNSKIAYSFQHDKIIQMFSPATVFGESFNLGAGLRFKIKGMVNLSEAGSWIEERNVDTKREKNGGKFTGGINYLGAERAGTIQVLRDNNVWRAANTPDEGGVYGAYGFINPSGASDTMNFRLWYRKYDTFTPALTRWNSDIYRIPEIADRNSGSRSYNGDGNFKYTNSLESLMTDKDTRNDSIIPVEYVNSYASRNLTMVLGAEGMDPDLRPGLDWIASSARVREHPSTNGDGVLIGEIIKPDSAIYMGGIYGGNRYEDKTRTEFVQIGEYKSISELENDIISPGDTFVQNFKLMRIGKTDVEVYEPNSLQATEIIEYPTETTMDLKNRNDISHSSWDAVFQPLHDEYFKYNRVYSQESTAGVTQALDYKFNEVKDFTTRVQASSIKIPNESIDSWTNILVNETLELDSKYGPINGLISFKDEIYTFQDEGIAKLIINPNIQIQSQDGTQIELGKGEILDRYQYITTDSGSVNKWSIVAGKRGIYYYDILNKGIGRVPDSMSFLLSDQKGMHSFYNKNYNYNMLSKDNPILKSGAKFGLDRYNNDVYFTLLQDTPTTTNPFSRTTQNNITTVSSTWCFNEIADQFIDLKPAYSNPSFYINKGDKLLISKDNLSLYEQYAGNYNKFFGKHYPSTITLMINPESDVECVFDNIHYNSEIYLNDIDQPEKTLTHIRAWNEYQDSGRVPLIVGRGSNIRRKFREWQADIPRECRDRIRNTWIYLYLELDNRSNYKMILHDIIIRYTV